MANIFYFRLTVFFLSIFLMFVGACGTTRPSKFYTLNSLQTSEIVRQVASEERKISVAIGPVEIPDYLDRPQIVVRSGQNEISVSEYDRWAGSLIDDITRVLAEDLSVILGVDRVSVFPSRPGSQSDYRIKVDITRFDIMPDDSVAVKAQWVILGKDKASLLIMSESSFNEHIEGRSYSDKIAAMSRALAGLSRDIAESFISLSKRDVQ